MLHLWGLKCGRYILFEKILDVSLLHQFVDINIKIVNDFNQLKFNKLGVNEGNWERLVQSGTDLFVYFDGKAPAGMMWGHRGSCYVQGPGISLLQDNDTVYWFWAFILPEMRGKNIFTKLYNAFIAHYRDVKKLVCLVEPSNKIMRREIGKREFVEAKRYLYVKSGRRTLLIERRSKTIKTVIRVAHGNHNLLMI